MTACFVFTYHDLLRDCEAGDCATEHTNLVSNHNQHSQHSYSSIKLTSRLKVLSNPTPTPRVSSISLPRFPRPGRLSVHLPAPPPSTPLPTWQSQTYGVAIGELGESGGHDGGGGGEAAGVGAEGGADGREHQLMRGWWEQSPAGGGDRRGCKPGAGEDRRHRARPSRERARPGGKGAGAGPPVWPSGSHSLGALRKL